MKKSKVKLTAKQELFCQEYAKTLNATQSAIKAKYSESTAGSIGSENLHKPEIQTRLQEIRLEAATEADFTPAMVLAELKRVSLSDMDDFMDWDDEKATMKSKDLIGIQTKCIQSIRTTKTVRSGGKNGDDSTTTSTDFKLYDKMKALELAGRHLGMFDDKLTTHNVTESYEDYVRRIKDNGKEESSEENGSEKESDEKESSQKGSEKSGQESPSQESRKEDEEKFR